MASHDCDEAEQHIAQLGESRGWTERRLEALERVLHEYFDFDVDSWHEDACPEPEDVWRLHRDLKAALRREATA